MHEREMAGSNDSVAALALRKWLSRSRGCRIQLASINLACLLVKPLGPRRAKPLLDDVDRSTPLAAQPLRGLAR